MNPKKTIKNYIGPSGLLRAICWILALASIVMLGTGAFLSIKRINPKDAARFNSLYEDSGDFVYLDAIAVDEWLCKYTVDGKTSTYYTILAADEYYYIAVLSDVQIAKMTAQQEFWYEYDYEQPIPADTQIYRLYGVARPITSEVKKDISEIYEMTSTEFDDYFGYMYINATTPPSRDLGYALLLGALISFAFWLIISPIVRTTRKVTKTSIKRLESLDKLDLAASEISRGVKVIGNDQCRLSNNFVFTNHGGGAIPYEDILWIYRTTIPFNGTALVASTHSKRGYILVKVHGLDRDGLIDSTQELIAERVPSAIVGFNSENREKYLAMVKELKNAEKNGIKADAPSAKDAVEERSE